MIRPTLRLRLGDDAMRKHRHLCAFFHSQPEQYEVLLPFVQEGVKLGDRGVHIVDPQRLAEHREALTRAGLDVDALEREDKLEIRPWHDAYLRDGQFVQSAMLALIEEVLRTGPQRGFPRTRLVANMEWALTGKPGVDDLVEYETRLNYVLPKYEDPVICTYDLARFDAGVVIDILRTHPVVIVGGLVQENPFFVPPDELLRELDARRAAANA